MVDRTEEFDLNRKIEKNELLQILKKKVSNIHISEIMMADTFLRADARYVPAKYREELLKVATQAFFTRIKKLKNDKENYGGYVDVKRLREFLKTLQKEKKMAKSRMELCFLKVAGLISIYVTFILEEPIHAVGTPFPGGLKVRYADGVYLCPVKDIQEKNPNALCRFCISVKDKEYATRS